MSYLQRPHPAPPRSMPACLKSLNASRGKTKKYSRCVVGGMFSALARKEMISKNISSFHFSPLIPAFSRADVDGANFTGAQHAAETLNPRRAPPANSFPGYGVFKLESRDLTERQRYPCITVATPPGNKEIRSSRRPVSRGKA